jgi:hypothetical protein
VKSSTLPLSSLLPEIGLSLPTFWIKELRVTLPIALGGVICMLLSSVFSESHLYFIFHFGYPIACSAIVALAFGHDYIYRTTTTALALPVSRQKIWWTRIGLCAALLVPIGLVNLLIINATWLLPWLSGGGVRLAKPWYIMLAEWLPIAFGPVFAALALAPALTILSRSPLFGTIISMAMPFVASRFLALFSPATNAFHLQYHSWTINGLLILGAVLSYRCFMTQQAIDSDASFSLKRRRKVSPVRTADAIQSGHPIWPLFKKEMMLQRLPAGISALFLAIIALASKDHAAMLSAVYPAAIIFLVGSIASADERRLGMIPVEVTHPISFRTQWIIKITVCYFTALFFGVVLPALALLLKTDEFQNITSSEVIAAAPLICGGVLLLLSITIYISSLSDNGIRAMLASLFIIAITLVIVGAAYNSYSQYLWRQMADDRMLALGNAHQDAFAAAVHIELPHKAFFISTAGFITLAFYFAMQNHRFLERSGLHLIRQVAALILCEVVAIAAIWMII